MFVRDVYRLAPQQLNAILQKIACEYNPSIINQNIGDFYFVERQVDTGLRKFVICPASRDSESHEEITIPFIKNTLEKFCNQYDDRDVTLLIPYALCRGYGKMPGSLFQRRHFVLLEANLATKRIEIHDSQDPLRWYIYPDKLMEIEGLGFTYDPVHDYHAYSTQPKLDFYSCGWHLAAMVDHIIKTGALQGCEKIGKDEQGRTIGLQIEKEGVDKYEVARKKYNVELPGSPYVSPPEPVEKFQILGAEEDLEAELQDKMAKLDISDFQYMGDNSPPSSYIKCKA